MAVVIARALTITAIAGTILWPVAGAASVDQIDAALDAREKVVARAEHTLTARATIRADTVATRARILFRLARGGALRAVLDPEAAPTLATSRALSRRLTRAAIDELSSTRAEIAHLEGRARAIASARAAAATIAPPASLERPVAGAVIGPFSQTTGGQWLTVTAGAGVIAPAAGRIAYIGPVRGLGTALFIAHDHAAITVIGPIANVRVHRGDEVEPGEVLATASAPRMFFALRLTTAAGVLAIDPSPFWSER